MRPELENYIKNNRPLIWVEKTCNEIKKVILDYDLPNIQPYHNKIKSVLKIPDNLTFKDTTYGLAKKFEVLRIVFYKLYAKLGGEILEFKHIVTYLQMFEPYFEWIQSWQKKKFNKADANVLYGTQYLKFYIEVFCYKYDFLLKGEEATLIENLDLSNVGADMDVIDEPTGNEK